MRFPSCVCVTAVVLCATGRAIAQTEYRYAFLTLPPLGGDHSYGWGINELGHVAGSAFLFGSNDFHATLWMNGQPIDLGTLGGRYSRAESINSSGWIVGWAVPTGGGLFDERAALWRDGQIIDLGTLGGAVARAQAVNEMGEIVGWSYTESITPLRAFVWRDGVMSDLGGFDSTGNSFAYDINTAGQIAGRAWKVALNSHRATLWDNGQIIDLGTLRSNNTGASEAYAVNEVGQIVGFSSNDLYRLRATLWYNNQKYDLGVPRGALESYAYAINNLGQVVGQGFDSSHHSIGFIWESGVGIQRLDDLLPPRCPLYPRLTEDINDAGQITGIASPKGAPESRDLAFLMTPIYPTMELAAPLPGTAGTPNTIIVSGVTSGATVHFLYSRQGGGTRIPGCDLQQNALQLDNPTIIGSAIADANGVASITRNVPLIARGQTILFQAVVQNDCAISQLVVHQFE